MKTCLFVCLAVIFIQAAYLIMSLPRAELPVWMHTSVALLDLETTSVNTGKNNSESIHDKLNISDMKW